MINLPANTKLVTTPAGGYEIVPITSPVVDIQQFDFAVNLLRALLWQYQNASNLQSLIHSKQTWYDENQQAFWQDFIINIFDMRTANEFGLSVWSIILQLPLFVSQPPTPTDILSWGFDAGSGQFDQSTFGTSSGETNKLPLETKRMALRLRYFQLCSSGTVPEINRFMNYLFGHLGKVSLVDNHDMTQIYIFLFPLTWDLIYLFNNFDLLPRPAGVGSAYRDGTLVPFGFGPYDFAFDQATFGAP